MKGWALGRILGLLATGPPRTTIGGHMALLAAMLPRGRQKAGRFTHPGVFAGSLKKIRRYRYGR